jgi:hypothetical protein
MLLNPVVNRGEPSWFFPVGTPARGVEEFIYLSQKSEKAASRLLKEL